MLGKALFPFSFGGCIILVAVSDVLLSPNPLNSVLWSLDKEIVKQVTHGLFLLHLSVPLLGILRIPGSLSSSDLPYSGITMDGLLSHHVLENMTLQVTRLHLSSQTGGSIFRPLASSQPQSTEGFPVTKCGS